MISSLTNVAAILAFFPSIGSSTLVTSATIFSYIDDVTNEIDAKIGRRYTLPTGSPVLQTLAKRMATYDLLTIRLMAEFGKDAMKDNPFFDRLKEARADIDKIANGTEILFDAGGGEIAQRTDIVEVYSNTKDFNSTFHEGDIYDAVQDPDKIDGILSDRNL